MLKKNKHKYKIMRKNKNILVIATFVACALLLAACGKSEEEKAADEIYENLDSEGQAAVDQMRKEVAAYEESQTSEPEQDLSNYKDKMVEWVIGEDIYTEPWDYFKEVVPSGIKVMFPDKDFVSNIKNTSIWVYGDATNGCMLNVEVKECENKTEGEESIGNYGVYVSRLDAYASTWIINRITNMAIIIEIYGQNTEITEEIIEMNQDFLLEQVKALPVVEVDEIPYGTYQSESGIKAEVADDYRDNPMVKITSLDNMSYLYYFSYRLDGTIAVEGNTKGTLSFDGNAITITGTGNIDGTYSIQSAPTIQGEIPYGTYGCTENNKCMRISIEDGEFDVIMFSTANPPSADELMADIVWTESNTYSVELGEKLATATLDEKGNIQITALSEEAQPYEGYYILIY